MFKKGFLSRAPFSVEYRQQVAAATMLTSNVLFANPAVLGEELEVIGVDVFFDVNSNSGTMDIRKVPVSTAVTGGTSLLTGTFSLATGARVATKLSTLSTNKETRRIRKGDAISLIFGGTLTSLVGLCVVVWLQPLLGKRLR